MFGLLLSPSPAKECSRLSQFLMLFAAEDGGGAIK